MEQDDFWEDPERVARFADRDPDHRLVALLESGDHSPLRCALDLGCAGGRNSEYLARQGLEVHALDASEAMVAKTRERLAPIVGAEAARQRVRRGRIDDLSHFPDARFDLVVAIGVFHAARSRGEWERAAAETTRVLRPGGLLLFNQFTPETDPTGEGLHPVPGEQDLYEGMPAGPVLLLDAAGLDAAWAAQGLRPLVPGETKRVELEGGGRRVSVNTLYTR